MKAIDIVKVQACLPALPTKAHTRRHYAQIATQKLCLHSTDNVMPHETPRDQYQLEAHSYTAGT